MLQTFLRRAAPVAAKQPAHTRSLWYQVGFNQDPEKIVKTINRTMQDDGVMTQLDQRFAHEKKWQRRIRKNAESEIRDLNKRMASIVNYCLKKQKRGGHL
ncbi:hypothetical protein H257_01553 [Aphanomyces astaci]|uniref:Ribosomal protein S21 n=1 Tax=Aphanomyces astaci TaxID=112090 RepID=W4HAW4_APHAT|nr:hypothetical protein H257_01553 [Aphanomyces astaci]ETV88258.1 hypothetical protein H257_01553 [Aphanomyces astaci]KAF0718267.1 hypothetical protein AaE_010688 [Aphanomyces astaci]RHY95613.1 hypothetical protein DYB35_002786 [Aphanomyces astaci]RHZ22174.1 hypothetical protein DYB37_001383 [Aphanomyces astaci]RLO03819.1 hypothetical protein DYB28_001950 [Aphanomyces astaci]|eukprot:XP_009823121.1 hypothetical protein H257_01553 [Aphanomyces astaci]